MVFETRHVKAGYNNDIGANPSLGGGAAQPGRSGDYDISVELNSSVRRGKRSQQAIEGHMET